MSYCNFNVSAVSIYDLGYWQWLAGPILYFVVFVFGLSQLIIHLCSSADNIRHYIIMLTMFLTSLLLRGLWFLFTCPTQQASPSTNSSLSSLLMLGDPDPYSSFGSMLGSPETFTVYQAGIKVMSKISLLLYFTAFTMYVYLWAKVMPFIKVKTLTLAFVVVNVLLWIVVAVLETVAILESSGTLPPPNGTKVDLQCGNAIYNSIICLLAVMQLLIAALFCGYGFQFMRVLRKAAVSSRRDTQSRKKAERRVLGVSIPSSILFLFRSVLFLYCPVAQTLVPHAAILYPWFFYLVPDLIPVALIFYMTIPNNSASNRNVQYETL